MLISRLPHPLSSNARRPGLARLSLLCALALAAPLACGPSGGDESESDSDSTTAGETDTSNELEAPDVPFPEPDAWFTEVYVPVMDQATKLSPDELLAEYPAPRTLEQVSYDPLSATYLDQIAQYSGMTPEHDALLAQNGFVAVSSNKPWSFTTTYVDLYYNDLPVLVTTDSVLYALHKSFDSILLAYEREALINEVDRMLMTMHGRLGEQIAANAIPTDLLEPARDMDLYLTVGRSLLGEAPVASLYGGDTQEEVDRILEAVADEAPKPITLFGVESIYDFSQMKPRGHYEDEPELQRYFRAMMWLGRTDLPMVTFDEQQQPLFNRRGLEAAMLANMLLDEGGGRGSWKTVDDVLVRLIGERDSMNADDMTAFMADVGVGDLEGLAKASDEKLYGALIHSPYGIQRIMSQIMYTDPTDPPVVLPRVYHLMGQRFTIDSYVFNNTTYDRVQDLRTGVKVKRMLPQELDVQFVLGNNQAAHHLTADLDKYGYQGVLHEMRFLVDSHPQEFWDKSFYNGWLDAIRALNDTTYLEQQPEPMRTKAWSDKQLNTQSASWAELRHDTLLYVKQSYSGGDGCEYPEAYVEPEPAFYARMGHLGALGLELTDELAKQNINVYGVADYFTHLQQTMATLEQIAHKELEGEVLTPAEWDFLRGTIEEELVGCGQVAYDGWYGGLFYDQEKVAEFKPTVADVHTAPTDEFGNDVGWVLHGATGRPMYMVFTVQDCSGVRAYIGPVSSYHPVLTEGFQRLTDSEWGETVSNTTPARAPWVDSFVR